MKYTADLMNLIGVTGYEKDVSDYIKSKIKKFVDNLYIDSIGNLIAIKNGRGENKKKVMILSHMDEVGFQVVSILNNGQIKIKPLGSLKVKNLYGRKVIFKKNIIGIITSDIYIDNMNSRDISMLNIDFGFKSYEETSEYISIGDVGTFYSKYLENDGIIIGKAIDNRASCGILIELIEKTNYCEDDLYFVFTVQEEWGLKGAKAITNNIMPDICIVVDTISVESIDTIDIGKGACIKVSDSLTICDSNLVNSFISICEREKIEFQLEVSDIGGTELGVIDELGIRVGGVSIPIKFAHTSNSMAIKDDIKSVYEVMKIFCKSKY